MLWWLPGMHIKDTCCATFHATSCSNRWRKPFELSEWMMNVKQQIEYCAVVIRFDKARFRLETYIYMYIYIIANWINSFVFGENKDWWIFLFNEPNGIPFGSFSKRSWIHLNMNNLLENTCFMNLVCPDKLAQLISAMVTCTSVSRHHKSKIGGQPETLRAITALSYQGV